MADDRLTLAGVALRPPDKIEAEGRVVVVGRLGLTLLAHVARRPVRCRAAKVRLWCDADAPDNRLKAVVYRLNVRLKEAGSAARVALDDGAVVLM